MTYPPLFWVFSGLSGLIVFGPLLAVWFWVWRHDDDGE